MTPSLGITTKYLPPTDHRGSRIKAKRTDHMTGDKTVTVGYDYSLTIEENHEAAADALAEAMGWQGQMAAASTRNGYVFVFTSRTA